MLESDGVGTGAFTLNVSRFDATFPGLVTCTVHVAADVVKVGLIVICVDPNELIGRFAKVWLFVTSRSVTVAPFTKLFPLMVKVCALADPVTGLGTTLLIDGTRVGVMTLNEIVFELRPFGLMTCAVHVAAFVPVVTSIPICALLFTATCAPVNVCVTPEPSTSFTVAPVTKFAPDNSST